MVYERPLLPKIQGIHQQIQSWSKDQLKDRIAKKEWHGKIIDGLVFFRETEHPKHG